jgi:hypothetical protein
MTRPIPHSGEQLPIVGLGTAVSFPSADESQRAALKGVIDALVAGGGKLIDTASVYGNAESVIGDIVRASNARNGSDRDRKRGHFGCDRLYSDKSRFGYPGARRPHRARAGEPLGYISYRHKPLLDFESGYQYSHSLRGDGRQ